MHCAEENKSTSTARLLNMLLPKSEIHVVGRLNDPYDLSRMIEPGSVPLVLFPEPSAQILTDSFVERLSGPVTLIVPDGTWKQARKLTHHTPELRGIRRVQLAQGEPSRYMLRRNQSAGGVCTMEAVARALGVLEGAAVQQELERYLHLMVQRVLFSRTTSRVYDGSFALPDVSKLVR